MPYAAAEAGTVRNFRSEFTAMTWSNSDWSATIKCAQRLRSTTAVAARPRPFPVQPIFSVVAALILI